MAVRRAKLSTIAILAASAAAALPATATGAQWRRVAVGPRARCLPVAFSMADQEQGLQGVRRVARPLVFVFPGPATTSFWMQDTPVALTGVWIGLTHRVVGVWHGVPNSTVLHNPPAPVLAVIEYAAGAPTPALGARFAVGSPCPPQAGGL